MRATVFVCLSSFSLAACSDSPSAPADAGPMDDATAAPDASDAATPPPVDASDASDAPTTTTTTLRIHYPAKGHAVTVRGSGGGLGWTAGSPTTASGDVFTYTLTSLATTIEWKPLLDDTTWARGPNYHVTPGATLDVWPHFSTMAGKVVTLIPTFHSTALSNDRAIYAYLPASYDENPGATFPVVYMHDGQNLWAALPQLAFGATWNVDTAFDAATEQGACSSGALSGWAAQPLGAAPKTCTGDGDCGAGGACVTFPEAIVIGVANTAGRIYEYTPTTDPTTPGGGGADLYLTMLVSELKPTIDGMLRTRPEAASTSLAGSSLGGLVTAYAGIKHADVFTRLGELSPSSWWNNDWIVAQVTASPSSPRPAIVYVDSGQGSVDDEADTDMLASAYLGIGYVDGKNFRHVIQAGAAHNEIYWAQRLPGALQLMLGPR